MPRRATSWCRCAPAPRSAISPPTDRACASGWPPAATPAASSRPPCRCAATTARWSTSASRRPRSPNGETGDEPVALLLRFRSRASGAQEQALHIAEARYRELFSNAVHGICRCHVDGTILEGNPALAAMLGHAIARVARRREAGRHLRGARRVPDARRSHPPRRAGPSASTPTGAGATAIRSASGSRGASRRVAARTASSS